MTPAIAQARKPMDRAAIQALIDAQPTVCPHDDCGEPRNCRERIRCWFNDMMKIQKGRRR
jgi:hypothetical protein